MGIDETMIFDRILFPTSMKQSSHSPPRAGRKREKDIHTSHRMHRRRRMVPHQKSQRLLRALLVQDHRVRYPSRV